MCGDQITKPACLPLCAQTQKVWLEHDEAETVPFSSREGTGRNPALAAAPPKKQGDLHIRSHLLAAENEAAGNPAGPLRCTYSSIYPAFSCLEMH